MNQSQSMEMERLIANNLFGYFSYFAHRVPTMEVLDKPELLLVNIGFPTDYANNVFRVDCPEEKLTESIHFVLDYFQSRNYPFIWWTSPTDKPPHLPAHLENFGFLQVEEALGMYADLHRLSSPRHIEGLEIRRVADLPTLQDFAQVVSHYHIPPDRALEEYFRATIDLTFAPESPVRFYIGYLDQQPVACSALYLDQQVAGIYSVVTTEPARRKGIAGALTLVATTEARQAGYRVAILQASPAGEWVYRNLGFEPCCHFYAYQSPR